MNQTKLWEDKGKYWHLKVKQGMIDCEKARFGRCQSTLNDGESYFGESKEDLALYATGLKTKIFNERAKSVMKIGTEDEPKAREWYQKYYEFEVEEMGLCVPKFNLNIGTSIDGKIKNQNGIIEIKCPVYMYKELKEYIQNKQNKNGFSHIKPYHYKQMQFSMGCLGADFCDYIVFSRDGKRFVQRIIFDKVFWDEMYKRTVIFWEEYIKPLIEEHKIKIIYPPEK